MFAVDDDLETSAKHEALDGLPGPRRALAFEAWLRLGAACRKRGNGGLVTPALLTKVLWSWTPDERAQAAVDLVAAKAGRSHGLWVVEPAGWRFHGWEGWQPSEEEAQVERAVRSSKSERQRKWRLKKKLGLVDAPVDTVASTPGKTVDASVDTPASTVDAQTSTQSVSRARDPVPSRPVPSPGEGGGERPPAFEAHSSDEASFARMAEVAWTKALGERQRPFAPANGDARSFKSVTVLVDATRRLHVDASTGASTPLAEALLASARAHLDARPNGSKPDYWLQWEQRRCSAAPTRAKRRDADPDKYQPAPTWEGETSGPVPLGEAGAALLASLGLKPPTEAA